MAGLDRLLVWIRALRSVLRKEATPLVDFSKLERVLKYTIQSQQLFAEALSHRSYLQLAGKEDAVSNERLEFLGDAVLNLAVAEYLFRRYTNAQEGELTKIRSRLV